MAGRMGGDQKARRKGSCTGMWVWGCVGCLSPVYPSCPMCPLCIPMYPPLYRILSFYCGVLGIDGWRGRIGGSDGLKRLPKGSGKRRILMETRGKSSRSKKIIQNRFKKGQKSHRKCLEGSPKVTKSTKSANNHQKVTKSNKKQQNRHSGSFGSPIWTSWSLLNHGNHSFKR